MTDPTLFANPATAAPPGAAAVGEAGLVEIRTGGGGAAAIPGVVATGVEVETPTDVRSTAVDSGDVAAVEATRAGEPVAGDGPRGGARGVAIELDLAAARGGVAGAADVQPAEGALRGANGTDGAAAVNGAWLRPRSRGACDGDDVGGVGAAANGARRRPGRGGGAGLDSPAEGSRDGSASDAAIGRARDAAGRAVASLDALLAALGALGGERLEERLGLVGTCENRLAAVKAETVAELARSRGEARAADVLRGGLKQSRHGAKREVKLAGQLAAMPQTSGALAEGAITPQHARIIAEAAEQAPIDEAELLAAAEHEPADMFGRTVRDHVNERIGDDLEERRRRQRAQREVSFGRRPDGMYALFGKFDPVAGRLRDAHLSDGTPLTPDELVRLACDANILPALFDRKSQPLWLGRSRRHASAGRRAALTKRDKGWVTTYVASRNGG